MFESQCKRTPDAVAVEYGGKQLTYRELNVRANQLARELKHLGVQPDSLVGLYLERSLEMVVALLGILKSGAAYVPMDTAYPRERLAFMLAHAKPSVLITQQMLLQNAPEHQASVLCMDSRVSEKLDGSDNLENQTAPDNLAYVIYTSGSTGRPKGVALTHRALVDLIVWQCGVSTLGDSGRTLQFTPLSFDVSFQEIFATWCSGGTLVLIDNQVRRDPTALLEFLQAKKIERLFLPFVALQQLAEAAAENEVIPWALREVYTAGEQLLITPKILKLFEKIPRCSLHNHYGPSESHVVTAFTLPSQRKDWEARPSIGDSVANCQVFILDEHLNKVSSDNIGEIFIGGSCLARGYLDRPDLTAERFVPSPFETSARLYKTGDMARWLPDGKIEFLGRVDHQVKIRGFRIELGEIETVLSQYPGVNQTAVVVREASPDEKRLVAYVVWDKERELSIPELRKFLKVQLPDYMVPSYFVTLAELPVTPSGKVDRRALPVVFEGLGARGSRPPRDRLELQLAEIWKSLLHVEHAGVTDNFFDLGGHSLLAVKLLAQIKQSFGRDLPLVSVFQAPTIEQMAQLLRQQGWKPLGESLVVVQPNGSRPPFFCVHGIVGYRRLAAYLEQDQPLYGLVQGLDGNRFFTRVEELAAHYLKDIKAICPEGPYFLGGHSFGGLVAFEMAQQLRKAGDEVGLLALFDPDLWDLDHQLSASVGNPQKRAASEWLGSRILRHLRQLRALPRKTRGTYFRERFGMMLTLLGNIGKGLICRVCLRLRWSMPPNLRAFFIREILFPDIYRTASQAYLPKRYEGRTVLIVAEHKSGVDLRAIWGALIPRGLTSHDISGDHTEILQEPHVGVLARHLRDSLNERPQGRLLGRAARLLLATFAISIDALVYALNR
jgi:amino acid adenylation domain-containing protein